MPTTTIASIQGPTNRYVGRCDHCVRPVAVEVSDSERLSAYRRQPCPQCGRSVRLERLYGVVTEMTCDPRCEGAIGPVCSCACGGANHSKAFVGSDEVTASAIAKYRAAFNKRSEAAAQRKAAALKQRYQTMRERLGVTVPVPAPTPVQAPAPTPAPNADLYEWLRAYSGPSTFLNSLQTQLAQKGSLSERQIAAARKNMSPSAAKKADSND